MVHSRGITGGSVCLCPHGDHGRRLPVFPVPGKNISALTGSDRRVAENRRRGTLNSFLSSTSEQTNKEAVEETNDLMYTVGGSFERATKIVS